MRSDREFVNDYRSALKRVDPSTENMLRDEARLLGLTELCLRFLSRYLSEESLEALPFLMMGYPSLLDDATEARKSIGALTTLRHLAAHFGSVGLWADACRSYQLMPEPIRCFNLSTGKPDLRRAHPSILLDVIDSWLSRSVPWAQSLQRTADPGEALVPISGGEVILRYKIPALRPSSNTVRQHELRAREHNPPIRIRLDQLIKTAELIDAREAREDWPRQILPPLKLSERLRKIRIHNVGSVPFDAGGTITISGATHLVGMLSSGKSTVALAIIVALTVGQRDKRIAVFAGDTVSAALLVDRLKRHGISATVLASFLRREKHLDALHWESALAAGSASLSTVGQIGAGFGTACPLDGWQEERVVVFGRERTSRWPNWREKPCRNIVPVRAAVDDGAVAAGFGERPVPDDGYDLPDPSNVKGRRLCPLFPVCPAQEQQRAAVEAQVIVMTPAAFAYTMPDPWVLKERITIPELLQYIADLVIIDEVDVAQKELDGLFAPREPIMGERRGTYVPEVATKSAEALRQRSGAQFGRPAIARWQSNFYTLSKLIGLIYGLFQSEGVFLSRISQKGPFTAASILCQLCLDQDTGALSREAPDAKKTEALLLEVMHAASAISRSALGSSVSSEEAADSEESSDESYIDPVFRDAAAALREIARQVLLAESYADIVDGIETMLDGSLRVFNAAADKDRPGRRGGALAILLAVTADLILSHYSWLVKAQPGVAGDLGIESVGLFGTSPLIRNYRTLLPGNPARTVFGLRWEESDPDRPERLGGTLTLVSHLGVGRHLIVHLHDLLKAEGQAGPHVLMLSGTSWAGGSVKHPHPASGKHIDPASPCFDVQVPTAAVLRQPLEELEAVQKSRFGLVPVRGQSGRQIRVSGVPHEERREKLRLIAERMARPSGGANLIEEHWKHNEKLWGLRFLDDRRRALFVVNSYADGAVVANALSRFAQTGVGAIPWKIFCTERDPEDEDGQRRKSAIDPSVVPLARSMIERFGESPERSILVAPIQIVSRGYNILNVAGKAAVASIYFLHRPHPPPDDLSSVIGRLNRFAVEWFEGRMEGNPGQNLAQRARRMRRAAARILREGLGGRQNYGGLSVEYRAQFSWDMLTQVWQAIGRGIRGGSPIFVGFVDGAFAPESFEAKRDTPASSVLVESISQLELALNSSNSADREVARLLYEPFYTALRRTEGLNYESS